MSLPWFGSLLVTQREIAVYSSAGIPCACTSKLGERIMLRTQLSAPTSLRGCREFPLWNGSWAGSGLPQQLPGCGEGSPGPSACAGSWELRLSPHLVPGGVPVVVILPVGQHPLLNLLVPALGSYLEAKIHLSGLQPPPVTSCHPLPLQV